MRWSLPGGALPGPLAPVEVSLAGPPRNSGCSAVLPALGGRAGVVEVVLVAEAQKGHLDLPLLGLRGVGLGAEVFLVVVVAVELIQHRLDAPRDRPPRLHVLAILDLRRVALQMRAG
eukprot:1119293-Pyramimonas_sp.AAC.1